MKGASSSDIINVASKRVGVCTSAHKLAARFMSEPELLEATNTHIPIDSKLWRVGLPICGLDAILILPQTT